MKPITLPTYTRTKAEALALAAEIAPKIEAAMAEAKADPIKARYPRYFVEDDYAARLRQVFEWLYDDRTRIYKRARWHLFYKVAHGMARALDENGQGKSDDYHHQRRDERWQAQVAAWTVTGDGAGI